jgi:hypothetical protein
MDLRKLRFVNGKAKVRQLLRDWRGFFLWFSGFVEKTHKGCPFSSENSPVADCNGPLQICNSNFLDCAINHLPSTQRHVLQTAIAKGRFQVAPFHRLIE